MEKKGRKKATGADDIRASLREVRDYAVGKKTKAVRRTRAKTRRVA